MEALRQADTIIFDMDGTLYFRGEPIPGAGEALAELRKRGYKLGFVTNTDGRPVSEVHDRIVKMGFDISLEEVYTPIVAAISFMEARPDKSCYCLVTDEVKEDFRHIRQDDEKPDYIIIGDFCDKVSHELINKVFRLIMGGAEILALSKTMYYFSQEGISINTGAFVSMFENACGKEALLMGKPSKVFFDIALGRMGSSPQRTIVTGDDLSVDIVGASNIGAQGVLVRTGHFTEELLEKAAIKPHYIIDDVSKLPELLGGK